MPGFSERSRSILNTCDMRLITVFNAVVINFDCTIAFGYRNRDQQDDLFRRGLSQLKFPQSKHNQSPSLAVDAYPYPIDWKDRERFTYFAGFVMGVADGFNINLRWGGDWNKDWQVRDNNFDDLGHFELVD